MYSDPTPTARQIPDSHTVPSTRRAAVGRQATPPSSSGLPRRSFFRGLGTASAFLLPVAAGLTQTVARADDDGGGRFTQGDIAILRFLAAAELIEADLWTQYAEVSIGNPAFQHALIQLDTDMVQYVSDNNDDEISHAAFLNGVLASLGEAPVNLDPFRRLLPKSTAQGVPQIKRLTSLTSLTVDTSWYLRYRSAGNPDFGDIFPQFINIVGQPAIPLHDNYSDNDIQAIANTAGFHFATIEQGGASLYGSLVPKATHLDVLRILVGIGGVEVNHFAVWHDKAGNAPAATVGNLVFPDLTQFNGDPTRQTNLIMPEPCRFLRPHLPLCSVIRPTSTHNAGAVAAITGLTNSGLFTGQGPDFFHKINGLAAAADAASRQLF
jgi:hypothetical protein